MAEDNSTLWKKGENAHQEHFLLFFQLIDCMAFSTVLQLYHGGQCNYPCFPGVLLTLSQMTSFRLIQTERVCRPQFQI